jgi:hypothetical protein
MGAKAEPSADVTARKGGATAHPKFQTVHDGVLFVATCEGPDVSAGKHRDKAHLIPRRSKSEMEVIRDSIPHQVDTLQVYRSVPCEQSPCQRRVIQHLQALRL